MPVALFRPILTLSPVMWLPAATRSMTLYLRLLRTGLREPLYSSLCS